MYEPIRGNSSDERLTSDHHGWYPHETARVETDEETPQRRASPLRAIPHSWSHHMKPMWTPMNSSDDPPCGEYHPGIRPQSGPPEVHG